MKARVARRILRASGLPSLEPVRLAPEDERRYDDAAEALLLGRPLLPDVPRLDLLRWLAQERELLFHGSGRGDLTMLEPIRLSRDATEFGDSRAVFASSDPVWAIYFATLRREGLRSTRNASLGLPGALYPRWYFFSHDEGASPDGRFGEGWLYVLPRAGFEAEELELGVLDTAHLMSTSAVMPLAAVPVSAADFPFKDRVVRHRPEESLRRTVLRAAFSKRRSSRGEPRGP